MLNDRIIQDKTTILQIIGCLLKKPDLLLNGQYKLNKNDFPEKFHKIIFAVITTLLSQGAVDVDFLTIDSFLQPYPDQYKIFEKNNGLDYMEMAVQYSNLSNFDYHFNRLKKFTLLREYDAIGIYVGDIYDPMVTEGSTCESMQEIFDQMSAVDIINFIDEKQTSIKAQYLGSQGVHGQHAGLNARKLKEQLKLTPEMGMPLCSDLLNFICRGARLRKLYMRSAATGVGKSRLAVADACNLAIDEIYDIEKECWIHRGVVGQPTLFITTELNADEIQTMIMAFISGVNEDSILDGKYKGNEEERVDHAIDIMERGVLYIEHMPNFDISDIEQVIKMHALSKNIKYIFFDYIHVTVKLLEQLANQSKGMKLREDNILLMFVDKLKDICNQLGVFIYTSTQLNGEWKNVKDADQNLLRGAKSMADKLDVGIIATDVTNSDLKELRPILAQAGIIHQPNIVYHVYKNRRGKLVRIKVWCYVDLGTCRTTDLFVTTRDYKIIETKALKILVEEEDVEIAS